MPRLRYLKNYEVNFEDEEEDSSELTGSSWLSNASIIRSLPDGKIRAAINYHKQTIRFLENELIARSSNIREYSPFIVPNFNVGNDRTTKYTQQNKQERRLRSILKKHTKLSRETQESLIQVWMEILKIDKL